MTEMTPKPTPRSPLWMRIALAVSLAVNLAIVGVAGGSFWRVHSEGGMRGPVRDLGFGPFSEALAPEDRREMRQAFLDQRGDFRQVRREMREDFRTMLATLRAEPFDPVALQAVLDRQQRRGAEAAALGSRLLASRIEAMTPAERRAFATRLEASLTRKGHHGERHEARGRD
ncbi:periplasmic heavy metal sensor [Cereibacter azotoformans]|uniref:Putative membrane protein n=1 Tax=Cereibacter azotoformans TaxID=43057 RepID=A0A2T5KBW8_9RHOB|nr:periplasmic heavy metal sensor [Cereibacter azotoformans]AXQ94217.1 periplasmic heavy metal sensor [Cereibacter sphaeroides]MBO4167974.1 periplasmic heavy metal sensor [Cereibacter azotoformans]PTR19906.1 putative membrane protein [Cereibacter azotoformans]UIJ29756.1 periplasmic heavy metal sensor [Cereibacter azotoformans]ULB10442.1 periplasmic heavy metal sensor [Cereibacter azotoformans]